MLRLLTGVGLIALSTSIAVLAGEFVARLVVEPADFLHATLTEDPILGHRIPPLTTGHDDLGFRNRVTPSRADIVAIGDSMTYGVGASRDGSWPEQLGALLGERVYNMALGGYGPLQYLHLAKTSARELKPRLVIVGFYIGNDLMDAFYLARGRPYWHAWRVSVEAELSETDYDRAGRAEPKKRFRWLRDWLSRNSVLYSMLRVTLLHRLQSMEQDDMARRSDPNAWMLWHDPAMPAVRTIFTPRLRLTAVDGGVRAVREGMQITKAAFAALKEEADQQGYGLLVVMIPTKERVYCKHLRKRRDVLPEAYLQLCDAEARSSAEITSFLGRQGIANIDVVSAFESQIERQVQLYPTGSDGHPQAQGYGVIAHEIAAAIGRHFPRYSRLHRSGPANSDSPAGAISSRNGG